MILLFKTVPGKDMCLCLCVYVCVCVCVCETERKRLKEKVGRHWSNLWEKHYSNFYRVGIFDTGCWVLLNLEYHEDLVLEL